MLSAGNDIISLATINIQRSNDSRFYTKILSASEQELYHVPELAGIPFEHFLWLLWSIKESVYKYLKRDMPDVRFSPTKIIIQKMNTPCIQQLVILENDQWQGRASGELCYSGHCLFESFRFFFKSKMNTELVATVVSEDATFEHTWWGIRKIDETDSNDQSRKVRIFLMESLQALSPDAKLRLEETARGYPVIFQGTKEINLPVSLSHHGQYIAYSFLYNAKE